MHPDRKIGFALGILLVGIVAALFFRNEPLRVEPLPGIRRAEELNQRLRDRDIAVFLDEPTTHADASAAESANSPRWTLPELVDKLAERQSRQPGPVGRSRQRQDPALVAGGGESPTRALPPLESLLPETNDEPRPSHEVVSKNAPSRPRSDQDQLSNQPESLPDPVAPEDEIPRETVEYTVEFGDTLSGISERFLGTPHRYQEIFEANRDRLEAPDRLRVGSAIRIPRY